MPKVNQEYIDQKKQEILDVAYRVAMSKPVYEVTMRDVIQASGSSQGWIYRYYSGLDDILIALINRECPPPDMEQAVEAILTKKAVPEQILHDLFRLYQTAVLDNLTGVGKIYFELCTMYANDHDRLRRFYSEIRLCREESVYQEKSFGWIAGRIAAGDFKPRLPFKDLAVFIAAALDGVTRDLILEQQYHISAVYAAAEDLDAGRMIYSVYLSVLGLLGGDVTQINDLEEND